VSDRLDGLYVVTGATGELGAAVAAALLSRGARVAVPFRDAGGFDRLRQRLGQPAALSGVQADVVRLDDARRFFDQVAGDGALRGVAACAGAWAGTPSFETAPDTEWTDMMSANLETVRATCAAALPHLLKDGGSVVTVASKLAERGATGAAAYLTAKAAVIALTRCLALENAGRGVRFNCVLPGTIDTGANRRAMPGADTTRWTSPAAIADVIVFLLSPAAAAVTGAQVPVDLPVTS
jgi:NAD(P)-dependent dehydrogenase (short-subunit alcohol dehydrogenase family)